MVSTRRQREAKKLPPSESVKVSTRSRGKATRRQREAKNLPPSEKASTRSRGKAVSSKAAGRSTKAKVSKASDSKQKGKPKLKTTFEFNDEAWEKKFNSLMEFKKEKCHCNVGMKDDKDLAVWTQSQRSDNKQLKKRKEAGEERKGDDRLQARMQRLKEIGFIFDTHAHEWKLRYEELLEYKREYGNCDVPITYNQVLATWVRTQRYQYKLFKETRNDGSRRSKSSMTNERIKLLEAAGFKWELRKRKKKSEAVASKTSAEMTGTNGGAEKDKKASTNSPAQGEKGDKEISLSKPGRNQKKRRTVEEIRVSIQRGRS